MGPPLFRILDYYIEQLVSVAINRVHTEIKKTQFHDFSMIFHHQQCNFHDFLMHDLQPPLLAASSPC